MKIISVILKKIKKMYRKKVKFILEMLFEKIIILCEILCDKVKYIGFKLFDIIVDLYDGIYEKFKSKKIDKHNILKLIRKNKKRISKGLKNKNTIKVGSLSIAIIIALSFSFAIVKEYVKKSEYTKCMNLVDKYASEEAYDKALKQIKDNKDKFKEEKYIEKINKKNNELKNKKNNCEYKQCISIAKSESIEITDDDRINAYTKAIDIKPEEEEAYVNAASILVQYNEYNKAVNLLSSGVIACSEKDSEKAKNTTEILTKKIDEINDIMFTTEYNNTYLEAIEAFKKGDLEEVLLKYNQCIEKNKNDSRLYVLVGKAYFNESKYDDAINILKIGIERLEEIGGNKKASKQYTKYLYLVSLKEKYEKIQKVSNEYSRFYNELLKACHMLEDGEITKVKDVILDYDFDIIAASDKVTYFTDKGTYVEKLNSGKGIAVYSTQYVYYGEWQNGKKSGNGYLIAVNKRKNHVITYVYYGQWLNDYPNGKGKIVYSDYKGKSINYKTITEGTFKNGYEDGKMILTKENALSEHKKLIMKYSIKMGKPVIKKSNGKKLKSADGSYIIGYYYDTSNTKREVVSIPVKNGSVQNVNWRVNGLPY